MIWGEVNVIKYLFTFDACNAADCIEEISNLYAGKMQIFLELM